MNSLGYGLGGNNPQSVNQVSFEGDAVEACRGLRLNGGRITLNVVLFSIFTKNE